MAMSIIIHNIFACKRPNGLYILLITQHARIMCKTAGPGLSSMPLLSERQ